MTSAQYSERLLFLAGGLIVFSMSLKPLKRCLTQAMGSLRSGDADDAERTLEKALRLVDELMQRDEKSIAAQLGSLGGSVTAKRGSEYFRELAARRKTNGGGRPRKVAE